MIKSMKMMKSRHSETSCHTTSLARRALVLISILMFNLGNIWGQQNGDITLTFNTNGGNNIQYTTVTVNGVSGANASITGSPEALLYNGIPFSNRGILCPNKNGSTKEPITLELNITGLPTGSKFDGTGLHIHALNSAGNYQNSDGAAKRQWNIAVKANDKDFVTYTDIDIAAGVVNETDGKAHKVWEQKGSTITTENGVLKLSLTIQGGTDNAGCFFGLEEIILKKVEDTEEEIQIPFKTKTLLYDDNNKCTPTLLQYWKEVAEDWTARTAWTDDVKLTFNRPGGQGGNSMLNTATVTVNGAEGARATITQTSGFGSWKNNGLITNGQITNAILCPNVNANTDPIINIQFQVDNIPANFQFNTVGLYIHALTADAGYQAENSVREWNVNISVDGEPFANVQNLDITKGGVKMNREIKANASKIVNGSFTLSLTITPGNSNPGCYFGLETITLKESAGNKNDLSNLNVRWYFEKDGKELEQEFTIEGTDAYTKGENDYYKFGDFEFDENYENTSYNPIITLPTSQDYEQVRLVCAMLTKPDDADADADNAWVKDPKNIKMKYVYELKPQNNIKEIEKGTLAYNPDTKEVTPTLLQDWEKVAEDCSVTTDFGNKLYVRWYFEDENGEEVAGTITNDKVFTKTSPNEKHGYYKYSGFAFDGNNENTTYNPTFKIPEGFNNIDIEKVHLVCIVTTETQNYPNYWIGDPAETQVKYVYNLTEGTRIKEKVLTYDEQLHTPTLLQYWNEIAKDCDISKDDLAKKLYVRWYLEDNKGNELQNIDFDLNNDLYTKISGQKGYYKLGGFEFDDNFGNTNYNPTITLPAGLTYDKVRLVCLVTTRTDDYSIDGTWSKDPKPMQVKYVYTLRQATAPKIVPITQVYDTENNTCTPTLLTNMGEVAKDLGVAVADLKDKLYFRWYFENKEGKALTDPFDITGGYTPATPNNENGYYKYGGFEGNTTTTITIPNDYNLNDVRLVCVATTNTKDYPKDYWIGDPAEMQVKYVYTLYAPIPEKHKVIIYDENTRTCSPHLLKYWKEVAIDINKSQEELKKQLYVRWYFEDENGKLMNDRLMPDGGFKVFKDGTLSGVYYRNGDFYFDNYNDNIGERGETYVPTFTMPATWEFNKIRLVCLVTTQAIGSPSEWDEDLSKIEMKYVYTLMPKNEAVNLSFVHYKGESGRDLQNGRQGVHTWEYDIYIGDDENGTTKPARPLVLPFQDYYKYKTDDENDNKLIVDNNGYLILEKGPSEDKEPRGYFRWYNWDLDKCDNMFGGNNDRDGNEAYTYNSDVNDRDSKSKLKKTNYGFFATCLGESLPTPSVIGMTIQRRDAKYNKPLNIACDVSKYADGMDESYTYLLHEPTLSSRYIFHIRPASELGNELDASKTMLEEAREKSPADFFNAMSYLREDKGKVVVSLEEGNSGTFSLRFDQQGYDYYFLKDQNDNYSRSTDLRWVVYFEDENGIHEKELSKDFSVDQLKNRIATFTYNDFITGFEGNVNAANADKFHVVGYACGKDGDPVAGSGLYAPVVHYELDFIEAPHIPVKDLMGANIAENNIERTDAYMNEHYTQAAILNWDGDANNTQDDSRSYYSTEKWDDAPTSSANNMSYMPFNWDDIQYSYCYPTLTHTIKIGYQTGLGVSPAHGDYMVLKSMNMPNVSISRPKAPNTSYGQNTLPYEYYWWDDTELHDYTYYATNKNQHGSFLYTDASDESRTIATLPFTANLCSGSYIYFTAAVANMTSDEEQKAKPQLLIRIVGLKKNEAGEVTRERLVAFLSGEMDGDHGKWYQFYGRGTLPSSFTSDITSFEAEIINYADKADGADFALDQIAIYVKNSKVLLEHEVSVGCDDVEDEKEKEGTVKVYMDAENLQNAFGNGDEEVNIYWRICKENGEVVQGSSMYPRAGVAEGDDGSRKYGISTVIPNYLNPVNIPIPDKEVIGRNFGWYKGEDGTYYFQIAKQTFPGLEAGEKYYVSVYKNEENASPNENDEDDEGFWGKPKDVCTIYSEFFVPLSQYVTYQVGNAEGADLKVDCDGNITGAENGVQMVLKVGREKHFETYDNIPFDYAFYPVTMWQKEEKLDGTEYTYKDLSNAWLHYRGVNSNYYGDKYTEDGLDPEYNTPENAKNYAVLKYAIEHGLLELSNSKNFSHFDKIKTNEVICLPTIQTVKIAENEYVTLCVPFKMTLNLKGSTAPELELGFMDVKYPEDYTRVVRVGLEQLTNMQKDSGYLLHIPVHSFKMDKNAEPNTGALTIISDYLELLKDKTNDTDVTEKVNIATFAEKEINGTEKMFISVNLHGDKVTKQVFKEGFTYHLFFQAKKKDYSDSDCEVSVNFLLKVVPEFVTWNDAGTDVTPNTIKNTNWNNDENWSRSKRAELYKESSDTPSPGHPNEYKDNATMGITTPASFVPMKFTYVTIPTGNKAPTLMDLAIDAKQGIYTNVGEDATDNIQYDMMVRYTEKNCLGHDKVGEGKTKPIEDPLTIYDCEKFYGNWAKEIYFKPEAELVNQHYLTYEKVWVEKKLDAGKWTLMSTPLQNTYAGDMYVPFADGKQATEAFQPIGFNTTTYSRTKYPIYQRSWAQSGSEVYTKTNDVRANSYSANITDGVNENFTQWSHTYNDVKVKYSDWKGFAIRAHKQDLNEKALLRLPKNDTQYDYYQWDNTSPTEGQVKHNTPKTTTGKLFTDKTANINGLTYGVKYDDKDRTAGDGNVTETADVIQNVVNYVLVGNPYLCSIDMGKFLKENYNNGNGSLATNGYWTYENSTIKAGAAGEVVNPLQSFFVKVKATNSEIKFTADMMTDGNNPPAPSRTFALTAANDRGQSVANVSVGEEAKNVETLFDSNLDDVPMVYTVADGQAVSINQVTELSKPIAFGVTCAANDEPVTVMFSDIEQLTSGEVYVVDAVTGEQTAISEGSTLTVQSNDYGRYFLLAGALNIDGSVNVQQGIVVSVRGRVVTVTSGEVLTEVRALSPDGATAQQATTGSTRTSLTLATSGVYMIKAKNVAGEQQTVKVVVKAE